MSEITSLRDPWLVAVWPGMGNIALLAGSYLLQQLGARRVAELSAKNMFEVQAVEVENGLATLAHQPRNLFFEWKDPKGHRDLILFIGEAQPDTGGYALCQSIIEFASQRGATRFFTFAAIATQLQPGGTPRVFAAATELASLAAAKKVGADVLREGQISGLNGVLLAAGADRGMKGTCLLGELPYFAAAVPNPRASLAVLEKFTGLAGIEIDLAELKEQAESVEANLQQLLERMQSGEEADEDELTLGVDPEETDAKATPATPERPPLDPKLKRKIETLFDKARNDRGKAFELKQELDRLGIFKQYEDRFLDLFRHAG